MAYDGGRRALQGQDDDRSHLPGGAGPKGRGAGLRDREDAPGRAVRDRGDIAGGDRRILYAAVGDRCGDERAWPGQDGGQSRPGGAGHADDAGGEARCGTGRVAPVLGAPGGGDGVLGRDGAGEARQAERKRPAPDLFTDRGRPAAEAASWAVEHLAERQAVFGHGDLLAAALAREPGAVKVEAAERAVSGLEREGGLHAARASTTAGTGRRTPQWGRSPRPSR